VFHGDQYLPFALSDLARALAMCPLLRTTTLEVAPSFMTA
jgi:hypothetical protein